MSILAASWGLHSMPAMSATGRLLRSGTKVNSFSRCVAKIRKVFREDVGACSRYLPARPIPQILGFRSICGQSLRSIQEPTSSLGCYHLSSDRLCNRSWPMLPEELQWIERDVELRVDPRGLFAIARGLEDAGNLEGAATAYDRVYGLDPTNAGVEEARSRVLNQLALVEHGVCFRYIPAGVFLMGSDASEPDEGPRHPVRLSAYWLSETTLSWATYCRLMDWEPPPVGQPRNHEPSAETFDRAGFHLYQAIKIRLQYCEDHTTRARDWHSHAPGQLWNTAGKTKTAQELFGSPPRDEPDAPWEYEKKPMVAIAWQEIEELSVRLSSARLRYSLPTEAQWEKGARGGLVGARYAWGDEPPTHENCDFDRFCEFSIRPPRMLPPNGYGLYGVNGGVWEWTRDWYDRDYYSNSAENNPEGPATGDEKTLRGGSWADCADAVTVSYRMSRGSKSWKEKEWGSNLSPNIGFRLCRMQVA